MLSEVDCSRITAILKDELIEATGCTEPIALALAGAVLREQLGCLPQKVDVYCSGNIVKNVKGVVVPNSGGLKGIDAAVLLGIIGGDCHDALQVIAHITPEHQALLKEELAKKYVRVHLAQGVPTLYILVKGYQGYDEVEVEIQKHHTNVSRIVKNGKVLFDNHSSEGELPHDTAKSLLSVDTIVEYGENVPLEQIRDLISRQIRDNTAISNEGLTHDYGACIGKTLMARANDAYDRAGARAAAGSDARMNGCPMPVVINSGSGNQGMTVSLPVIEFAEELQVSEEKLYRALVIGNLLAIHQKKYIGALSAYCGAVSAAAGAAGAICWLKGGTVRQIGATVSNAICTIGGMVCDGAKSSCAGKIAMAVEAGLMGMNMALNDHNYQYGEGLIKRSNEETIEAVGRMAREGMKSTDIEILNIMLED
ncbi:MAG: serine dehydratase subunit alpha family protein [Erysipelotrichaceae bacterium]|nr:serine dehydratase subunit alpha family protein [Erysipelotrichaceae bacterium]